MNLFWSRSVWLYDYDQLLWKTNDHVIITLLDLGWKNESCNITIGEQSKFETYITETVTSWSVVSHSNWLCIM